MTLLLGVAVMIEVAVAAVPHALLWQLAVVWAACSIALGLREGRRWALHATATVAMVSPGLTFVAVNEVGPLAAAPFLLAPAALALLIPARSARWLRRRPAALATGRAIVSTPASTAVGTPAYPAAALAVQSDYALVGLAPGGRVSG